MSTKSVTLNRAAAAQLEYRKHPQLHLYEDEEFDAGKKDPEADDPNEWLLGPERQLSSKAKA